MQDKLVLFGAGAAGRYAVQHLRNLGIEPICFADNDHAKWHTQIDGLRVMSVGSAHQLYGDETWVACAISRPAAPEIRSQIALMGVKTKPLWRCIPVCHGLPSPLCRQWLYALAADQETKNVLCDQFLFRDSPNYDKQKSPSPTSDLYFPNFIVPLSDEHFVDCGAADGDTVKEFLRRWPIFDRITAFEPDRKNYKLLLDLAVERPAITAVNAAVSDVSGEVVFFETGDYSAHVAGNKSRDSLGGTPATVTCCKLDALNFPTPPTYIKMDIEGSELEALWGVRKLLKEHMPVLAICAYHTSDHLWEIPLLIHAIQPDYKLYLRRYAEGAFETVWYAVPPERIRA